MEDTEHYRKLPYMDKREPTCIDRQTSSWFKGDNVVRVHSFIGTFFFLKEITKGAFQRVSVTSERYAELLKNKTIPFLLEKTFVQWCRASGHRCSCHANPVVHIWKEPCPEAFFFYIHCLVGLKIIHLVSFSYKATWSHTCTEISLRHWPSWKIL